MNSKTVPSIVPPGSKIKLIRADEGTREWRSSIGRVFRVGYYSRHDGLYCIWLVNEKGKYEQTTDRENLIKYFEVLKLSEETDLYGDHKPPFHALD